MPIRVVLALLAASLGAVRAQEEKPARDLPAFLGPLRRPPEPRENPTTPAKEELGRRLFYDPRLSGSGAMSCATCHNPALGWADGLALGVGFGGQILGRSSPTVLNAAYYETQFWDGRAASLEEQAKGPIQAAKEMNSTAEKAVATVRSIPGYARLFQEAFGGEPTFDRIAQAIASFERTVVDLDSPFDRWARGDEKAMSEAQVRGLELFVGKARCGTCHSGPNFADKRFHNVGVGANADEGRAAVTKEKADLGAFKTPTVRNAALTAPYMHDGSLKTLREVIDHYERAAAQRDRHPNLSILMQPFTLTEGEKKDLEDFMRALTGDRRDPRIAVVPELPR